MDRFAKDIRAFIANDDYAEHEGGLLIHRSILLKGIYVEGVNGEDFREHANLIPTAGINYILNAALGNGSVITTWYVAPLKSGTPVAGSLPSFVASNELPNSGGGSDGYSESTRQLWAPTASTAGFIDDYAAKATFTIACATTMTITGAALVSVSTIGSTAGTLVSASNFTTARTVASGDSWQCGYRVTLTDS